MFTLWASGITKKEFITQKFHRIFRIKKICDQPFIFSWGNGTEFLILGRDDCFVILVPGIPLFN
jgi:hypothetical protein